MDPKTPTKEEADSTPGSWVAASATKLTNWLLGSGSKTSPPLAAAELKQESNESEGGKEAGEGGDDDEEDIFTVEKIIGKKRVGKKFLYLVKWENHPTESNSWEPVVSIF